MKAERVCIFKRGRGGPQLNNKEERKKERATYSSPPPYSFLLPEAILEREEQDRQWENFYIQQKGEEKQILLLMAFADTSRSRLSVFLARVLEIAMELFGENPLG